ncbi:NlpC/P60 family protein [Skermania sp. ID1734]|nr:NlpC/P60 family protein [Skermania sp. ID1734]TSD95403.1 NlpC/P60 family protein [Skermania sp. ID1734]
MVSLCAVTVVALAAPGQGAAVPPPPPNPSDNDIAQASAQVQQQLGAVGDLINQVANANQQLAQLNAAVAAKREQVNKALVDLQNARSAADVAASAVGTTQQALAAAGAVIEQARQKFDSYASQLYTEGNGGIASVASFLGSGTPQDVLDRVQLMDLMTKKQQSVMDDLQRSQLEEANKNSQAREAKQQADAAEADAEAKKTAAEQAIATVQQAVQDEMAKKQQIEQQRDAAQSQLDAAKNSVNGLEGQRDAYVAWDNQQKAEQAAQAAAAEAAKKIALEAAAKVAADQAARDRAAELASGERSHTSLDDQDSDSTDSTDSTDSDNSAIEAAAPSSKKKSSGSKSMVPTVTGSTAVETVVNRGLSQLGVPYSWGGGDENGPTLGIHDGGVADSYGDYKKVGFDCSGLMVYAFAGIGISLPHYSGYQYTAGEQVPSSQMKRGDMLFWGANGSEHVALYLGDGKMLEAPESGDVVKISPVRYGGMMPNVVRMVDS